MPIVMRRGTSIGAMSAEDDERFLTECFVETGQAQQVTDITNPKCIALGRTGSGKSAMLLHVESEQEHYSWVNPEDLSLNYISNSNILRFFDEIGINLDVFYQLLWRHVLVVELLKLKKEFHDQESAKRWFAKVYNSFDKNPKRQAALDYLTRFNNKFWLDTEKRVREVVDKIEGSLEESLGMNVEALRLKVEANAKETHKSAREETSEIINRAQKVVSEVQIQELNELMKFLSEDIFNDRQSNYFLLIDDLDTGWVHDSLRFKLIRALIETIKKFRKIKNVKIIISLRADLLHTVVSQTNGKGFQTEKFEDLMLRLKWSKSDLRDLVEKRLNYSFKDQYTGKNLRFEDIFTSNIGDITPLDYMLARSFQRPRDIISFVNQCFEEAEPSSTSITAKTLRKAEAQYSSKRFTAISDEWREAYGDLEIAMESLKHLDVRFKYSDLSDDFFNNICLRLVAGDDSYTGKFASICNGIARNDHPNYSYLRKTFIEVLYVVGAIGIKRSSGLKFEWSYKDEPVLNYSVVAPDTTFAIHPMLHRKLNLRSDGSSLNT